MTLWNAVLLAAVICLALKAVGYAIPTRFVEAPRPARIADLLTVALLGALVAVQALGAGQAIVLDARLPALLVAAGLLALRAPFLVVVVAAAAVAALLRLVGWAA
ncbi:AzlD domain-containing protein [Microbacterium sp. BG28]|uniref:AzlD domain-containing protein n=1 Tax=Microbacterium sp. BG28 TaxID=3097356 RepID=UPI002A5AA490|nr:AzlD domain-containing protein [Microbacterium sp. BG28]MDY0828825.1 AzlD domain-containing protein [Microbacterium sp. BG28]